MYFYLHDSMKRFIIVLYDSNKDLIDRRVTYNYVKYYRINRRSLLYCSSMSLKSLLILKFPKLHN